MTVTQGISIAVDTDPDTDDFGKWPGFSQWFTLQHYDRFDGKYVPPILVATVEVDIHGQF